MKQIDLDFKKRDISYNNLETLTYVEMEAKTYEELENELYEVKMSKQPGWKVRKHLFREYTTASLEP